jgi:MFS family permease
MKLSPDQAYDLLFEEDQDARVCEDIPEEACTRVAGNFVVHLGSRLATKLGDALSSPRLVLTWLMAALGVSPTLIGFVVPLREAGSLLPQVAIGSAVRRMPVRKWVWVGGSVAQGIAVLAIGAVTLTLRGGAAGWAIIALLAVFAFARGVCSVTSKDLVGKTVPRRRRGRLTGLSASIAGAITVLVGGALVAVGPESIPARAFAGLLAFAGAMWLVGALVMTRLAESPGATAGAGNAFREALASFSLLRRDPNFRRFVVARGLLASTVLSMPFYVLLARDATGDRAATLGLFLISSNLATMLSGYTWGKLADRSSRHAMMIAGLTASLVGVAVFVATTLSMAQKAEAAWGGGAGAMYAAFFFLLSYAHTGIRVGRKTYLVDFAPAAQRPSYVAVSNTVIGVVLLASGSLGVLGTFLSPEQVILVFALLGIAGAAVAATLDEVE